MITLSRALLAWRLKRLVRKLFFDLRQKRLDVTGNSAILIITEGNNTTYRRDKMNNWFDEITEKQAYDMGYNMASASTTGNFLDAIPNGMFATINGLCFERGFKDYQNGKAPQFNG